MVHFMEQKYNDEIKKLELESRLMAQTHSKLVCMTDILKLKNRIEVNEQTIRDLEKAIEVTKKQMLE